MASSLGLSKEDMEKAKAAQAALSSIRKFVGEEPPASSSIKKFVKAEESAAFSSIKNLVKGKDQSGTPQPVQEIAQKLKQVIFLVVVNPRETGGEKEYFVGIPVGKESKIQFSPTRTGFMEKTATTVPSAVVVPTTESKALAESKASNGEHILEFQQNVLTQFDVNDTPVDTPRVILTTQLTGCTFAIGTVENSNSVVMGHCQAKQMKTTDAAKSLRKGAGFQLPEGQILNSKFFICPGDRNADNEHFGYDAGKGELMGATMANVLGLVLRKTLYFIVAVLSDKDTIVKVYLVKHAVGSKEWTTSEA